MEPLQSRRVAVGRVVAEVRLRAVRRPPEVELGVGRIVFGVMVRADRAGRRPPEPRQPEGGEQRGAVLRGLRGLCEVRGRRNG